MRNPDDRIRRLERAAAGGDPEAQEALWHAQARAGELPPLPIYAAEEYVSPRQRTLTPAEERVRWSANVVKNRPEMATPSYVAYRGALRNVLEAMGHLAGTLSLDQHDQVILVPVPGHLEWGNLGGNADVARLLADRIGAGWTYALQRDRKVPSSRDLRRSGQRGLPPEVHATSMVPWNPIPPGSEVWLIDNVAVSGATLEGARRVLGPAVKGALVYARAADVVLPPAVEPNPPPISFTNWHHGDVSYTLYALTPEGHEDLRRGVLDYPALDTVLGRLDYQVDDRYRAVHVNWVHAREGLRRQGIGTALWRELERRYPGYRFPAGILTQQGAALRRSVGHNPPPSWLVLSQPKLEDEHYLVIRAYDTRKPHTSRVQPGVFAGDIEVDLAPSEGRSTGPGVPMASVSMIDVPPVYQRQGVGTALYHAAAQAAWARGMHLSSDFILSSQAQSFWRKQVKKGRARPWTHEWLPHETPFDDPGPVTRYVLDPALPESLENPPSYGWHDPVDFLDQPIQGQAHSYRYEILGAVERAVKAGAKPPLTFVGMGAQGIVFCEQPPSNLAYKVARWWDGYDRAHAMDSLRSEFEWLSKAKESGAAPYVAEPYRVDYRHGVLVRECVRGERPSYLYDLEPYYKRLEGVAGWRSPERGLDQWVMTSGGPKLVDAGFAVRLGDTLADHVRGILDGVRPLYGESWSNLAWEVGIEAQEGRIDRPTALKLLAELRERGANNEVTSPSRVP